MRGATFDGKAIVITKEISIHAPHAGCDLVGISIPVFEGISIHAPHAGCDSV